MATKGKGSRKAAKPKTFFQKLQSLFARVFTAPSIEKAEKTKKSLVRQIKAKGYSPSYQKRLLRAVESGKATSLQTARGHKPGEARRRAERERKENAGLTSSQIRSIKSFHKRFDPRGDKRTPSEQNFVEYAQKFGYERFGEYRDKWKSIRRNYERQLDRGTYASAGSGAFMSEDDFLEEFDDITPDDNELWFYYH